MKSLQFLFAVLFLSVTLFAGKIPEAVPDSVKTQYKYLYSLPVETLPDGSKTFHKAKLFERHGIRILSLKGDRFEMAFQHGKLLKDEIKEGALKPAAEMLDKSARNSLPNIPVITNQIIKMMYNKYPRAIIESSLKRARRAGTSPDLVLHDAYGMSEGSGTPLLTLFDAATGPEGLQVILGTRYGKSVVPVDPPSSCSAFAAWDESTTTGEMIIGRNTDYPLNGNYDRFPTVMYFEPTTGQKYMAVTSAGLHNAGVVGFNESGIYLGVHTVPSMDVSTDGMPIFMIAQEVLREARNFDEAIELFKKQPPAAGWAYMVVSTKERKVTTIELSNKGLGILPARGSFHVQTNHYRTEGMVPKYLHVNHSIDEDTFARFERIRNLKNQYGKLDINAAMSILGDKVDPYSGEFRGVGNVVAVHTTLTSVVLRPEHNRIYVANGLAPVSLNSYVELPLINSFDADRFSEFNSSVIDSPVRKDVPPAILEAEQEFIKGKIAFESKLDYKKAIAHMKNAFELEKNNPSYGFVLGILHLKSSQFNEAIAPLQVVSNLAYPHHRWIAHYYLGRIQAHLGNKEEALRELNLVAAGADPKVEAKLLESVKKSLQTLQSRKDLKLKPATMTIYIQEADMVSYD